MLFLIKLFKIKLLLKFFEIPTENPIKHKTHDVPTKKFEYARDDSKQTDAKSDGNLTRNSSFSYTNPARHMKQNLTVCSFFTPPLLRNDIILEYMPPMSNFISFS